MCRGVVLSRWINTVSHVLKHIYADVPYYFNCIAVSSQDTEQCDIPFFLTHRRRLHCRTRCTCHGQGQSRCRRLEVYPTDWHQPQTQSQGRSSCPAMKNRVQVHMAARQ